PTIHQAAERPEARRSFGRCMSGVRMNRYIQMYSKLLAIIHLMLAAGLVWLALRTLDTLKHSAVGWVVVVPPMLVLATPAIWCPILAVPLGRRSPGWTSLLRWTHGVVLAFALSQIGCGWIAIGAAERSAAHGGGLLGGLGYIQAGVGLGLAVLALLSLPLAIAVGRVPTDTAE